MNVKTQPISFLVAGALCLLITGCNRDFSGEIKQLRQEAADLARETAMAEIEPSAVAAELGLPWPVEMPVQTEAQIREAVGAQVGRKVDEKFPEEMLENLRQEIQAKYPLIQVGTKVEFVVNRGQGVNPVARGLYKGINKLGRHEIGDASYHADEFSREDLVKLNPAMNERQIEIEYRRRVSVLKDDRNDFGKEMFDEMFSGAMKEAGYVNFENKWLPVRSLIEQKMAEAIAQRARKLEPEKQQDVFTRHGYAMKDGEWKPSLKKQLLGR